MVVYLDAVFFLNFVVDYLLLVGSNRLFGYPPGWLRTGIGAAIGSIYTTICMLPMFSILTHPLLSILCWIVVSITAFGFSFSAVRRSAIFLLLCMALNGISMGIDIDNDFLLVGAAIGVSFLCFIGLYNRPWSRKLIPVEIINGDKFVKMMALLDTGNFLRDPVSGQTVLVVGRDIGEKLIGLCEEQLRDPIDTLDRSTRIGLRLIPYKTIGQTDGIMLAKYFPFVKIGGVRGGQLVAFSAEILSQDGSYQALLGGI